MSAQGNALGYIQNGPSPEGASHNPQPIVRPFRARVRIGTIPRALPWANIGQAFGLEL
jgi:hypothetical protein